MDHSLGGSWTSSWRRRTRNGHPSRRGGSIVAVALALLAGMTAACATPPKLPPPSRPAFTGSVDDFYEFPSHPEIVAAGNGEVLRWQQQRDPLGTPIPGVYRVMYRTTATQTSGGVTTEIPVAATAAVSQPFKSPPPGGFPTVALLHGTTGLLPECGPSRNTLYLAWQDWMRPDTVRTVAPDFVGMGVDMPALRSPDAEFTFDDGLTGLPLYPFNSTTHPYLSLEGQGRATLDAVRAGRALELILAGRTTADPATGIGMNADFLTIGPSQGGQAALGTAEVLSRGYAPELRLRAVIAGAPAGHLQDLSNFSAPARMAFVPLFIAGMSLEFRDIAPSRLLNRSGWFRYDGTGDSTCLFTLEFLFTHLSRGEPVDGDVATVAADPALRHALLANSPGEAGHPPITVPVFVGQVGEDPVIDVTRTRQTVAALRERGAAVTHCEYPPNVTGDPYTRLMNHIQVIDTMWSATAGTCSDWPAGPTGPAGPNGVANIRSWLRTIGFGIL